MLRFILCELECVTNNYGDTFDGKDVYGHDGDYNGMRTGVTTEEFVGDITRTITGNVTDDITGDISEIFTGTKIERTHNISGDVTEMVMAAGKIELSTTVGSEISSVELVPSKKGTISGDESWFNTACKSSMVAGIVNENFVGGKLSIFGGMTTETFGSLKVTSNQGVFIENKKNSLGKKEMELKKVTNSIITKTKMYVSTAKLHILG